MMTEMALKHSLKEEDIDPDRDEVENEDMPSLS